MGFPSASYCVAVPKPLVLFVQLLDHIEIAVSAAINYLHLTTPTEDDTAHRGFVADPSGSGPPSAVSSAIKQRLPVVRFESLRTRWPEASSCAVCLGWLKPSDEVRQLGNCRHAFHRGCIDRWVDIGRVTCPLCRSHLVSHRHC
ncbi:hypothetical protein J5N97_029432 [Dioscorea zingiberensis]|uniref:RING-type domain-containing protein n=1 Tax=Dioscorea zingiberensis TaxID=325984 RepID=A0A9D5C0P5_9LILI|nr:hypothetical protein J5N97_029432 [Dioscorea zingiberensis]